MTIKRALALALIVLAALPAAAFAQEAIPPPGADNFLQPYFFNDFTAKGQPKPLGYDPLGFTADTTSYTVQSDMYNPPVQGGPAEPTSCGNTNFGNTIWSVFHSDRWGLMTVETAGNFDSVIAVVPFDSPDNPVPDFDNAFCFDGLTGFQEKVKFVGAPYSGIIIVPKQWYAIQVSGTSQTGTAQGGQLQVKIDQNHSPELDGDVILSWAGRNGQAKITKLIVSAPKGSKVAVTCTHHGCGKNPKAFIVRKARFTKPVGLVGPSAAAQAPAGARMTAAGAAASSSTSKRTAKAASLLRERRAVVHAAKKFKLLAGRKLKNGSKVEIRITQPGFIGKYFSYSVSKGQVASKKVFCLNPSSSKPRKKCG